MKLVTYDSGYKQQLADAIVMYFKEMHPTTALATVGKANEMIDMLLDCNRSIYLLVTNDVVIGFLVVCRSNQYEMVEDVLYGEYMFIHKPYRSRKAIRYLYTMVMKICQDLQLDGMCSAYHASSSNGNSLKLDGVAIATTYMFPLEKQKERYMKYLDKVEGNR